jgi:hypothetical protein
VSLTTTRLSVTPAESFARPASTARLDNWMSGVSKSNVSANKTTTSTTIDFDDDEEMVDGDIVSTKANKDEDDEDMWNFEKS